MNRYSQRWREILGTMPALIYLAGWLITFIYLTFIDDSISWSWWNWIVLLPMHFFLASIWPAYWTLLHWIF